MKREDFERLLKQATEEFKGKKKQPTTPAKQFEKGAMWLWDLLMAEHDIPFYEEQIRTELIDRIGAVEPWQESLITELAEKKVRLQSMIADIEDKGYLLTGSIAIRINRIPLAQLHTLRKNDSQRSSWPIKPPLGLTTGRFFVT